jgi:hypothetical protein
MYPLAAYLPFHRESLLPRETRLSDDALSLGGLALQAIHWESRAAAAEIELDTAPLLLIGSGRFFTHLIAFCHFESSCRSEKFFLTR